MDYYRPFLPSSLGVTGHCVDADADVLSSSVAVSHWISQRTTNNAEYVYVESAQVELGTREVGTSWSGTQRPSLTNHGSLQ